MGLQRFDYAHLQEWAITENNAVGPTTSMTLRTLDTTTPTDLNAVYLAMNGSDAGANGSASTGILTAPVLTLEKAIDVMLAQTARNTIHIIRNLYVGDLLFTATDLNVFANPATFIMQVALGETATISFNVAAIWSTSTIKLNGIYFNINNTAGICFNPTTNGGGSIKWCSFKLLMATNSTHERIMGNSGTLLNSIIDGNNVQNNVGIYAIEFDAITAGQVTNNIFANTNYNGSVANHNAALFVNGTDQANIEHNVFCNNRRRAITFKECTDTYILNNIFMLNDININRWQAIDYSDPDLITNNLLDKGPVIIKDLDSGTTYPTPDSSNIVGIISLFIDQINNDFRLQDRRRQVVGGIENYLFSSRAVYDIDIGYTISDDAKDLGPYDVSYTLITDTWDSLELDNEFFNDPVKMGWELINHQGFNDIRGNYRRAFDAKKRVLDFGFVSNNFTGTQDSYKLMDLISEIGAKRWYPNGDDGVFIDTTTITNLEEWLWSAPLTTNTSLVRNSLTGFICELSSGASTYFLKIASHSSGTLTLEDHRHAQATLSAGAYDLICTYLPVEIDQQATEMEFTNWDPASNPLMIPTVECEYQHYEGHIRKLVMRETEVDV